MWKAMRFEGTEENDPLDEMAEFVNAQGLQLGQFQFSVAADEEGYQYCVMLYSDQKVVARDAGAQTPAVPARGERPNRFAPPGESYGSRGPRTGRPEFRSEQGDQRGPSRGGPRGGGRPGGGRPGAGGRPGTGGRPGGGDKRPSGPKRGR